MANKDFQVIGGGGDRAAREDQQERIMRDLQRDWDRHPELRAEYGGNFQRYLVAMQHNVRFGAR